MIIFGYEIKKVVKDTPPKKFKEKVREGRIYGLKVDRDNPFGSTYAQAVEVLNGWVKYHFCNSKGRYFSMQEEAFLDIYYWTEDLFE